jgi:hypothetical protein
MDLSPGWYPTSWSLKLNSLLIYHSTTMIEIWNKSFYYYPSLSTSRKLCIDSFPLFLPPGSVTTTRTIQNFINAQYPSQFSLTISKMLDPRTSPGVHPQESSTVYKPQTCFIDRDSLLWFLLIHTIRLQLWANSYPLSEALLVMVNAF